MKERKNVANEYKRLNGEMSRKTGSTMELASSCSYRKKQEVCTTEKINFTWGKNAGRIS